MAKSTYESIFNNAIVSQPQYIAEGVAVRKLIEFDPRLMKIEGYEPRVQIVLDINENTNFDSINRNRKKFKELLRYLGQYQGSNLGFKQMENLYGIVQWREEGISWGKLTKILNYLAFALTFAAYDERQMGESVKIIGKSQDLPLSDMRFVFNFGGVWLWTIYSALGMTLEEVIQWIKEGYDYLAEDRFDFDINWYPFKKQQVIDKVSYFLEGIGEGRITISKNDKQYNALEHIIYYLDLKGCFANIDKLLDKEGVEEWKRNKAFLKKWMASKFEKFECSQDPRDVVMRKFDNGESINEIVRLVDEIKNSNKLVKKVV